VTFPWKSALVTGASSGIGAEVARQLGASGIDTVIVARRAHRLDELASQFPSLQPMIADLQTAEGVAAVAERLAQREQPIELLVNNAGFGIAGPFADVSAADHQEMISLNIGALVALTAAVVPVMQARGRGWILQVSSMASFQPGPGAATYSATKAFVTSHSEALHEELRAKGVVVSALCPGYTRTEFHERSGGGDTDVPDIAWLSSADVAADGLRAVAAGRALAIPGLGYKGVQAVSGVLPRSAVRRLVGVLSRSEKS
jgi:uncharacterized protein